MEELQVRVDVTAARPFGMAMIGTVLSEEHHHPELLAHFRRHVVAPRRALLRAVLEAAKARGEIFPDTDLDRAAAMMIGSYYAAYLAGEPIRADWPERTVDALLPSLLRLSPRRTRRRPPSPSRRTP